MHQGLSKELFFFPVSADKSFFFFLTYLQALA